MPRPPLPELTAEDRAAGGRATGARRRRQTAREIALAATTEAVRQLLEHPPELTDEQQQRLRSLLAPEAGA